MVLYDLGGDKKKLTPPIIIILSYKMLIIKRCLTYLYHRVGKKKIRGFSRNDMILV